jgi:hypothetical protein
MNTWNQWTQNQSATYSMVQELSWKLNTRSAGEAISFFHNTRRLSATGIVATALYWTISWDNFTSHRSKSHYNFILLSTPHYPKWCFPLRFPRSNFFRIYQFSIAKMSCLYYFPWFHILCYATSININFMGQYSNTSTLAMSNNFVWRTKCTVISDTKLNMKSLSIRHRNQWGMKSIRRESMKIATHFPCIWHPILVNSVDGYSHYSVQSIPWTSATFHLQTFNALIIHKLSWRWQTSINHGMHHFF